MGKNMPRNSIILSFILLTLLNGTGASASEPTFTVELALKLRTVFIDPAYGGEEKGPSLPGGELGKDVTLEIAKKVQAHLEARGLTVPLSRSGDEFVELDERVSQARLRNADFYLGIRIVRSKQDRIRMLIGPAWKRSDRGVDKKSDDIDNELDRILTDIMAVCKNDFSLDLATAISRGLRNAGLVGDVGVYRSADSVLISTAMPAVIVEFDVARNAKKQPNILSADFRHAIAQCIADTVKDYVDGLATGEGIFKHE